MQILCAYNIQFFFWRIWSWLLTNAVSDVERATILWKVDELLYLEIRSLWIFVKENGVNKKRENCYFLNFILLSYNTSWMESPLPPLFQDVAAYPLLQIHFSSVSLWKRAEGLRTIGKDGPQNQLSIVHRDWSSIPGASMGPCWVLCIYLVLVYLGAFVGFLRMGVGVLWLFYCSWDSFPPTELPLQPWYMRVCA